MLFFDTETTGLIPGRIIQLSYVMQSETETQAKNFFFAVEYIEPSAVAVHGFTPEEIARYQKIVESTAHLILQFSQEGGVENAAGF